MDSQKISKNFKDFNDFQQIIGINPETKHCLFF